MGTRTFAICGGKYEFIRSVEFGLMVDIRRNGEHWSVGMDQFRHSRAIHGLLDFIEELEATQQVPIDMILYCPNCGTQHVDGPDERLSHGGSTDIHDYTTASGQVVTKKNEDRWTNPPHRSHLCHSCGTIWRPADVPTNGVAELKTSGKSDTWVVHPEEVAAQPVTRQGDIGLLHQSLHALVFHQEQTRPIQGTSIAISALRARLIP